MTNLEKFKLYNLGVDVSGIGGANMYSKDGIMITFNTRDGIDFAMLNPESEDITQLYKYNGWIKYDIERSTVYFNFPAEFMDHYVISLGSLPSHAAKIVYLYNKHLGDDLCVTLDFSDSDLSNVIYMGNHFSTLGKSRVILPDGERRLKPVSINCAFKKSNIVNINDVIKHIDFSLVISAKETFAFSGYTELDFTGCDFGNVKTAEQMMDNCVRLESVKFDKGTFKKLENTRDMLYKCSEIRHIDLGCITGGTVKNLSNMFSYCTKLYSVEVPNGWADVISEVVLDVSNMFYYCYNLSSVEIEDLLSLLGEFFTDEFIFYGCNSLDLSNLTIYSDDRDGIELAMAHMNKDIYDIRGTRVINLNGDAYAISIINEATLQDVHKVFDIMGNMEGTAIILDVEQYRQNIEVIKGYQKAYGVEIIKGDTETIDVTLLKIKAFSGGKVSKGTIFVDEGRAG